MNGIVKNYWNRACYSKELGLFVAVAGGGESPSTLVMTSPDALNWTARTAPMGVWQSVCWSPEKNLFVAVGDGNKFITSPNGINWTERTAPNGNNWRDICWAKGLGLFVAISSNPDSNKIATSPDGINWTGRTPQVGAVWMSISWSEELGLLLATPNVGAFMTSPDAINWTARTNPADSNYWTRSCWSKELGLFVAINKGNSTVRAATSPDGITWTPRTCPQNSWWSICWAKEPGLFIVTSDNDAIMTSPDGINWTAGTLGAAAGTGRWYSLLCAETSGLIVAISQQGSGNDQSRVSRDGLHWSSDPGELNIAVTGITLDPGNISLEATQTQQLAVTITPPDATNKTVVFFSGNNEVATVSNTGLVTGIAAGTAAITVTTNDGGFTATCEVTVGNVPPIHRLMYIIKL